MHSAASTISSMQQPPAWAPRGGRAHPHATDRYIMRRCCGSVYVVWLRTPHSDTVHQRPGSQPSPHSDRAHGTQLSRWRTLAAGSGAQLVHTTVVSRGASRRAPPVHGGRRASASAQHGSGRDTSSAGKWLPQPKRLCPWWCRPMRRAMPACALTWSAREGVPCTLPPHAASLCPLAPVPSPPCPRPRHPPRAPDALSSYTPPSSFLAS